ncbi:hypothetical protein O3P69_001745 [Scylla paramamosain]|uniref:Uncharacterized protein n=1 Tax=Scylla paramamosain TaxID=85552 RepID=A0AAW0UZQ3_SCYPA
MVTEFLREHHPKQKGQADVLNNMSEMEFFRHLRLTRKSFDDTLDLIHKAYGQLTLPPAPDPESNGSGWGKGRLT